MKKAIPILLCLFFVASQSDAQRRYLDPVFTDVAVTENVPYGANISVITGSITLDTLLSDFYFPVGDTCAARPLAIVLHTGTFLPKGLLSTTGGKDDYSVAETCRRLAKMGYVAAAIEYRLGWNAASMVELERRAQIIQAAYRSVQDLYTFIRFGNLSVEALGNPFGLDMDRVALFGIGTGGFVTLNAALIDDLAETNIPKFQNPITGDYFISRQMFGEVTGEDPGIFVVGNDTFPFNIPNHVGYSNDFHFCFATDGGLGDSTWIDGDKHVPIVLTGIVNHPTTPFGVDMDGNIECDVMVRNGLTGDPIVPIAPTKCAANRVNANGYNDILNTVSYDDPVSVAISGHLYAEDHLWPIHLPGAQTGPWAYWDSTFWKTIPHPFIPGLSLHHAELQTNPDMSLDKANRYIDTLVALYAPRAYVAMSLEQGGCLGTATNDISPVEVGMTIVPNPAHEEAVITLNENVRMERLMVMNIEGKVITQNAVNGSSCRLDTKDYVRGIYLVSVVTEKGVASMRLVIE